jgi:hypothetical protein
MEPFNQYPEPAPSSSGPSSAQKAVAAVAILLGALGMIGGCWGVVTTLATETLMDAQSDLLGGPGMPGAEAQRAYTEASRVIIAKWALATGLAQLLNIVASGLLLASGVQVWRSHAKAALLTFVACGSNAVVDIFQTFINVAQQREIFEASSLLFPSAEVGNLAPAMESTMQGIGMLGSCFAVGWLLIKLISYAAMSLVMRRRA